MKMDQSTMTVDWKLPSLTVKGNRPTLRTGLWYQHDGCSQFRGLVEISGNREVHQDDVMVYLFPVADTISQVAQQMKRHRYLRPKIIIHIIFRSRLSSIVDDLQGEI